MIEDFDDLQFHELPHPIREAQRHDVTVRKVGPAMNAREALNSAVEALEKMGFVILSHSEWEAKDREIAKLREALREAAVALDQAREDVACWGSYAGEYFQDKHDLEGDLDRLAEQASAARAALKETSDE